MRLQKIIIIEGMFDFSNYTIYVAIIQIVAAFVIYYITNWLGGHTPSDRGYMTLSLVIEEDTMPAFNFVFKTLTPVVLYTFYIAICQSVSFLTHLCSNSYLVMVYYWLWRMVYYSVHEVWRLVNYKSFILYVIVTIALSVWVYEFSEKVQSLFPSKDALRDQIWILIAIFIYQVLNRLKINREATEDRKQRYIMRQYKSLSKKYEDLILSQCTTLVDQGLVYSIMIVENYNRPTMIRGIEYLAFFIKRKKMSLGIMQVKTEKYISEIESVRMGAEKIVELRKEYTKSVQL